MNQLTIIKENWLTRKPADAAFYSTFLIGVLVAVMGYFFLDGSFNMQDWMPASNHKVFAGHEYWRLWTTLFAHADTAHLLGNLSLLLPLAFMLTGYYGVITFPVLGVLVGGLTNYIVLTTMRPEIQLIGISGVVYWMGAIWMILYLCIENRKRLRQRIAHVLFLTVVLFIPESYKPEISYLSHLVGFALGVVMGLVVYALRRKEFKSAEVIEYIVEDEEFIENIPNLETTNVQATNVPSDVPLPKSVI